MFIFIEEKRIKLQVKAAFASRLWWIEYYYSETIRLHINSTAYSRCNYLRLELHLHSVGDVNTNYIHMSTEGCSRE